MKEQSLVSWPYLFVFSMAVSAGVIYSIPDRLEVAVLKSNSFEEEEAIEMFREQRDQGSRDIKLTRYLSRALEKEGDIVNATLRARELVEAKPKNREYWNLYIQQLKWGDRWEDAHAAREAAIRAGAYPIKRSTLLELADGYSWYQRYDNVLGVYDLMREKNLVKAEDLDTLLRAYIRLGTRDQIQRFVLESLERKIAGKEFMGGLFAAAQQRGFPDFAAQVAARYLGATENQIEKAWEDVEYVTELPIGKLKINKDFVESLVWFYSNYKKQDLALPIYTKMFESKILNRKMEFNYLEFLLKLKKYERTYEAIAQMVEKKDFKNKEWRKVSQMLMYSGQKDEALSILESLLEDKSPRVRFIKEWGRKQSQFLRVLPYQLAFNDLQVSSGERNWVANLLVAESSTEGEVSEEGEGTDGEEEEDQSANTAQVASPKSDRLKTYELLIEVKESKNDVQGVIDTFKKILAEMATGRIRASQAQARMIRVRLAERYIWYDQPKAAVQLLQQVPFRSLPPEGKAIYVFALEDAGNPGKAKGLAKQLSKKDRKGLDRDILARIDELITGRARRRTDNSDSAVDTILLSNRYFYVEPELYSSQSTLVPALHSSFLWGIPNSSFGVGGRVRWKHLSKQSQDTFNLRGGMEWRLPQNYVRLEAGYLLGGNYWGPQARLDVTGNLFIFDYAQVGFELSRDFTDSEGLVTKGVSESRLEVYYEKRLLRWLELYGAVSYKWTHKGSNTFLGEGIENWTRFGIGDIRWPITFGPYIQVIRWNSDDQDLKDLLVEKQSIMGAFARLIWGGGTPTAFAGHLVAGAGVDLSSQKRKFNAIFAEGSVKKAFTPDLGLRLIGDVYTTPTTGADTTSYSLRLGAFKKF